MALLLLDYFSTSKDWHCWSKGVQCEVDGSSERRESQTVKYYVLWALMWLIEITQIKGTPLNLKTTCSSANVTCPTGTLLLSLTPQMVIISFVSTKNSGPGKAVLFDGLCFALQDSATCTDSIKNVLYYQQSHSKGRPSTFCVSFALQPFPLYLWFFRKSKTFFFF